MVMFHSELLGAPRIFSEGKQISLEARVWYRALVDFLHVLMKSTKFGSRFQQKYGDLSKKNGISPRKI